MSPSGCSTGSSGSNIAAMTSAGHLHDRSTASSMRRRAEGKLDNLGARARAASRCTATIGIAHTRWATHGAPTVGNAHPHVVGRGRPGPQRHHREFQAAARGADRARAASSRARPTPRSSPISSRARSSAARRPQEAVAAVLPRLHGAFALAFLFRDHPDLIIGARMGAPLTVGYGDGENYLGSDALALAPLTQRIAYLDEGDWAVVRRDEHRRSSTATTSRSSARSSSPARPRRRSRRAITATSCRRRFSSSRSWSPRRSRAYVRPFEGEVALPDRRLRPVERSTALTIVACGTSLLRRAWSPNIGSSSSPACRSTSMSRASSATASRCSSRAGWRCSSASRARPPTRSPRCATPARRSRRIAVVVNVPTSSMAREADLLLPTHAGPGDRRRLDQGLHLPARGARRARRQPRARQGPAERARRSARSSRHLPGSAGRAERARSAMTTTSPRWRT